ncbi:Ubiquitin family protein [Trichomonas vaginalis G3]|uniref:Ubiquitin family protein n=1 Tax=Trichomonas vaginalis (strain ATCC PRA-98 / G3) TaxID=412133 RepID=A2DL97_TRIV3|nr:ubiquitin family protein family [Trichomonas vaginalis G3]EAY18888.1 Ubiquitin family protein [Trichomonas vaginalis G3]KAI5525993.1 ubiquitin family protein family [Trichomonas vaginalis G3]|eukprot:XP_001579874.1 Ubiquitin family protein [Trichomonas vaginalis G3]
MKIQITGENTEAFEVEVDSAQSTVVELKAIIASIKETDYDDMHLFLNDKELDDEKTLEESGIQENTSLKMVKKSSSDDKCFGGFPFGFFDPKKIQEMLDQVEKNPKSIYQIINQFPMLAAHPLVHPTIQQFVDHPETFKQII